MTCSACGQPLDGGLGALLRHLLAVFWVDFDRHRMHYTRLAALVAVGSSIAGCVGAVGLVVLAVVAAGVVVMR